MSLPCSLGALPCSLDYLIWLCRTHSTTKYSSTRSIRQPNMALSGPFVNPIWLCQCPPDYPISARFIRQPNFALPSPFNYLLWLCKAHSTTKYGSPRPFRLSYMALLGHFDYRSIRLPNVALPGAFDHLIRLCQVHSTT